MLTDLKPGYFNLFKADVSLEFKYTATFLVASYLRDNGTIRLDRLIYEMQRRYNYDKETVSSAVAVLSCPGFNAVALWRAADRKLLTKFTKSSMYSNWETEFLKKWPEVKELYSSLEATAVAS